MYAALDYHNGTKHPHGHLMDRRHTYDPRLNPLPFKIYRDLAPQPLPRPTVPLDVPTLVAVSDDGSDLPTDSAPNVETLFRLLHYSAGITKTIRYPWGEIPFRAAACTGALYHIELYLVCGDLKGLAAGVYHFDPRDSSLVMLRSGDYRAALVEATGGDSATASAPAVIAYSDVFWRNSIKYQAREYRHAFWDSGTIIANTLAMATALEMPASVVSGFVDESMNRLLGLDSNREAVLALVAIGRGPDSPPGPSYTVEHLRLETVPVSDFEIDFPAIQRMHAASSLTTPHEVVAWREAVPEPRSREPEPDLVELELPPVENVPQVSVERVIRRRGSTRRFRQEPITYAEVSTILSNTAGAINSDYRMQQTPALNQPYLIANAVDGLRPGTYAFHRELGALEPLRTGDFRNEAGHLGLGQELAADASLNIYFLTDLERVLDAYGDRGYRVAQLEASIAAGKMYLAAYALGLGATGLTFFDDAVTEFFSPHAAGKSVMFLIAIGHPQRRRRPIK